ncbi:MAG: hypothetical protein P9M07_02240 [Candidatus Aceula meridiana]|nr:hypothetical protein [Candidatus Aceula meridiana]
MERIGIAASRIAKGNLWAYNAFVVLITFLFSLLVFVISGLAIICGVLLIVFLTQTSSSNFLSERTIFLIHLSLTSLAIVIGCFNLFAIGKNIKIKKGTA